MSYLSASNFTISLVLWLSYPDKTLVCLPLTKCTVSIASNSIPRIIWILTARDNKQIPASLKAGFHY